ncbi:unnamed protein product [Amaranthus hypochondriacus]
MTPLPNISQAYRILVAEQKHKEIGKQSPVSNEALGFATERNTYYNKHPHSTDSANKYKGSSSGQRNHSGNKKQNVYYCEHCRMAGHTIDRCYKIHGHPSTNSKHNNNKKIANAAQIQESEALNSSNSPFTDEQYSYLMTLINKEKEQDHIKNDSLDDSTNSALLAGPFNEKAMVSW